MPQGLREQLDRAVRAFSSTSEKARGRPRPRRPESRPRLGATAAPRAADVAPSSGPGTHRQGPAARASDGLLRRPRRLPTGSPIHPTRQGEGPPGAAGRRRPLSRGPRTVFRGSRVFCFKEYSKPAQQRPAPIHLPRVFERQFFGSVEFRKDPLPRCRPQSVSALERRPPERGSKRFSESPAATRAFLRRRREEAPTPHLC